MLKCSSQSVNGITPQGNNSNFILKWFNQYSTIWYMATCHPHVNSVFFIELIPNAITMNSQLRPGGKMDEVAIVT